MAIKSIINQIIRYSTVHGLSNIIKNRNKFIQTVWFIFFIGAASICAYLTCDSISQYLQYEVISRIEVKFYNQMVFPMVTICRANPFATQFSEDLLADILKKDDLMKDYNLNKSLSNMKLEFYSKKNYALLNAANLSEIVKKKFGNALDDILLSCLYNFQVCNLVKDFEEYYDYFYGNCFRFNSKKLIKNVPEPIKLSPQGGLLNGLQLEFFVGAAYENNKFFSSENGLNMFIHNESDLSFSHRGIKLSAGYSTFIVLDKYTTRQIAKPFSDCTSNLNKPEAYDSELFRKMLEKNHTYTQTNCRYMCYQKYLGDNCNCQLYSYRFYSNMSICLSMNFTNCQIESMKKFVENQLEKQCDCPLECQKTFYGYKYSFNEYPTKYYANILAQHKLIKSKFSNNTNLAYEDLRPNIAAINIFYDELKQTFITQEKRMIFFDLISNIGSILGLFLGMSFLSFIELLEILIEIILFKTEKKKNYNLYF